MKTFTLNVTFIVNKSLWVSKFYLLPFILVIKGQWFRSQVAVKPKCASVLTVLPCISHHVSNTSMYPSKKIIFHLSITDNVLVNLKEAKCVQNLVETTA